MYEEWQLVKHLYSFENREGVNMVPRGAFSIDYAMTLYGKKFDENTDENRNHFYKKLENIERLIDAAIADKFINETINLAGQTTLKLTVEGRRYRYLIWFINEVLRKLGPTVTVLITLPVGVVFGPIINSLIYNIKELVLGLLN